MSGVLHDMKILSFKLMAPGLYLLKTGYKIFAISDAIQVFSFWVLTRELS